jgi:hypothetical protein
MISEAELENNSLNMLKTFHEWWFLRPSKLKIFDKTDHDQNNFTGRGRKILNVLKRLSKLGLFVLSCPTDLEPRMTELFWHFYNKTDMSMTSVWTVFPEEIGPRKPQKH